MTASKCANTCTEIVLSNPRRRRGSLIAEPEKHPFFELRVVPGKGYGLVATQHIKRGTRNLEESPILALLAGANEQRDLSEHVERLTQAQSNQFFGLCHCAEDVKKPTPLHIRLRLQGRQYKGEALDAATEDGMKTHAIFKANAVKMGSKGQYGTGVFALHSRINHSCLPNVHSAFNATLGKQTLHAIREIHEGEELVRSYVTEVGTAKQRAWALEHTDVDCECEACEGPSASAHEARRQRISELQRAIAIYENKRNDSGSVRVPRNPAEALTVAENLVVLFKEEGLVGMNLADAYRDCANYSLQQGDIAKAIDYAKKELEVERYCIGTETAHLKEDMEGAECRIEHLRATVEKDAVKYRASEKRHKKEEKRQEKKAAKKAGKKGGR